jgi:hypothetical protein
LRQIYFWFFWCVDSCDVNAVGSCAQAAAALAADSEVGYRNNIGLTVMMSWIQARRLQMGGRGARPPDIGGSGADENMARKPFGVPV